MRKRDEKQRQISGRNCDPLDRNNDFTLGVESQRLTVILAFDIKPSDGVEDFYTGRSDARTERAAWRFVPVSTTENGAERSSLSILRSR
jgi:hypothetical protein